MVEILSIIYLGLTFLDAKYYVVQLAPRWGIPQWRQQTLVHHQLAYSLVGVCTEPIS